MQTSKMKKKSVERNSLDNLYRKRDRALEHVIPLWQKDQDVNDALTLAHTAATFKFVGG
jgi:hypothetical protein